MEQWLAGCGNENACDGKKGRGNTRGRELTKKDEKMKKIECQYKQYEEKSAQLQKSQGKSFEEISRRAKGLASAIKNSPEYQDFVAARERLEQDAMNKKVLHELREQQINFQYAPIDEDLEQKANFLNEMYMAISLNPVISDYLNAEYRFGLIMDELKKDFEEIFVFEDNFHFGEISRSEYQS